MSEEENKAIELLKQEPDFSLSYYKREHAIDIVLSLIEKQQKEIEELKNTETYKIAIIDKDNYISKDKIKEEIKKLSENNGVAIDMHTGQIVKTEEDYKIAILRKLLRSK